jgi:hypothetical protein
MSVLLYSDETGCGQAAVDVGAVIDMVVGASMWRAKANTQDDKRLR